MNIIFNQIKIRSNFNRLVRITTRGCFNLSSKYDSLISYNDSHINHSYKSLLNKLEHFAVKGEFNKFQILLTDNKQFIINNITNTELNYLANLLVNINPRLLYKIHDTLIFNDSYNKIDSQFLHFIILSLVNNKQSPKAYYILTCNMILNNKIHFNTILAMITSLSKELNALYLNNESNEKHEINEKNEKNVKNDSNDKNDSIDKNKQAISKIDKNAKNDKNKLKVSKLSSFQLSKTNIRDKDKMIDLKNKLTFLTNYIRINYAKDDISLIKRIIDKLSNAKKEKKKSSSSNYQELQLNTNCAIF